jgi:hypothetical protein
VSSHKRIFILTALVGLVLIGWTVPSEAQGRRGGRGSRVVIVGGGYYADPFFYDPFWGYGYPPYPYMYPPYGYGGYYDSGAALRLEVKPKEAEVYVDGYYAGVVDDFDGVFQRLRAEPGEHELTLYRDGYRTVTQHVYLAPDSTFKVKYTMEPLAPGETAQPRPVPSNQPMAAGQPPSPPARPGMGGMGGRRPPNAPPPPVAEPRVERGPGSSPDQSATGALEIRVQPADADVLIDGQPWRLADGQDRIVIDTSEGGHTVQVRKSGYVGYLSEVQIRRGETTTVNVNLRRQQ